jgi:2-aminobenzoate-CoA ligase
MKDIYPLLETLPAEWLVPPDFQPDYLPLPGISLPDDANIGVQLSDALVARGLGDSPAIVHYETGHTLTFSDLSLRSDQVASALVGLGVRPGQRILLRGPNRPDFIVAALGAWKMGAIVIPAPLAARAAELGFFLDDAMPTVVLTGGTEEAQYAVTAALRTHPVEHVFALGEPGAVYPAWDDILEHSARSLPGRPPSPDSVAVVWHTGGTTGRPKACYHTHRRFLLAGHSLGTALEAGPGSVWAAAAPVGHALGFIHNTNFTLQHGATTLLIERLTDARALLQAIIAHRVNTFTAISATWSKMLTELRRDPALEPTSLLRANAMWQSASSFEVYDGWRQRGIVLYNNFGSTAFATWVLVPPARAEVPRGSLGPAAAGYQVAAMDPQGPGLRDAPVRSIGRMAVKGPTGLTYWRLPDLQRSDVQEGWTLVDDLINYDDEGNAAYLGRTDFMVSTAGHKVAPVEVESVLARHPCVREVAVIGLPDQERQEVVAAFIALHDDCTPSDELKRELQQFAKRELAPYKYPRRVEWVEALPRDHVGKVLPRLLRDAVVPADQRPVDAPVPGHERRSA